jgi:hypothetical protein
MNKPSPVETHARGVTPMRILPPAPIAAIPGLWNYFARYALSVLGLGRSAPK